MKKVILHSCDQNLFLDSNIGSDQNSDEEAEQLSSVSEKDPGASDDSG